LIAVIPQLYDELDFQRAVQAYLWAMPFVSYAAATDASLAKGANNHTVLIQPNSAEQQQLILTGNQDTVYLSGVLDLREGPVVVELPFGLLGTMNNLWQEPLTDLGGPFSPEQSRGGRFLVLPPDYDKPLPKVHYHVVKSDTNFVVFYVRAVGQSRDDWPKLAEQMRQWRQYPLAAADNPPETVVHRHYRNRTRYPDPQRAGVFRFTCALYQPQPTARTGYGHVGHA